MFRIQLLFATQGTPLATAYEYLLSTLFELTLALNNESKPRHCTASNRHIWARAATRSFISKKALPSPDGAA